MQWWNDFVEWVFSDEGWRIVSTAILPFFAILVGALVAAAIARGSVKRLLGSHDRESSAAAVSSVINVARRSAVWGGLSGKEQDHLDYQSSEATTRLRLLPISGASLASDWSEFLIADIKRNSTGFSVQAEQNSIEVRERLIDWHSRPSRAKKLFAADIDHFRLEDRTVDKDLIEKQRQWAEKQANSSRETAQPAAVPVASPLASSSTSPTRPTSDSAPSPTSESSSSSTPLVPPASSRIFVPPAQPAVQEPSSDTRRTADDSTGSTEVIDATIDDETTEPETTSVGTGSFGDRSNP